MKLANIELPGLPRFQISLHEGVDRYITEDIFLNGKWEPFETELVCACLPRGGTFLDVGANIGWYTIVAALVAGPNGIIYAFEPDPNNFSLLLKNLSLNDLRNVKAENVAVGRIAGKATLHKSEDNLGDHRLYPSEESRETIEISVITLDDYCSMQGLSVDVIKLDTQGSEFDILLGFSKGIRHHAKKAVIIAEFWPYGLYRAGATIDEMVDVFAKLERYIFLIDENSRQLIPIVPQELRSLSSGTLRPETKRFANLLLWPEGLVIPDHIGKYVQSVTE